MLEVQTWHIPLWHILHRAVDGVGACLSALPGTSVFCRQDETKPKVKSRILLCFLIKAGNRVTIVNPTRQSKQSQTKAGLHLLPFWQTFTHFPTSISIWNLWFKTFEITHRINNPVLARQSEATLLSTLSIMKKKSIMELLLPMCHETFSSLVVMTPDCCLLSKPEERVLSRPFT